MDYMYTPAAAAEDARTFLNAWGNLVRELYLPLVEPFTPFLLRVHESAPPLELLTRFLAVANLAAHPHIAPMPDFEREEYNPSHAEQVDLIGFFPTILNAVYRYASGGESYSEGFDVFDAVLTNFTYLAGPSFVFRAGKRPGDRSEVEEKLLSEKVSPRFATAVRLYSARQDFERAFFWSLVTGDPELYTVPAPTISVLSGLSYPYIIKLIKTEKIPARKDHAGWRIPAIEAAKFFNERNEAPEWLKQTTISIASRVATAKKGSEEGRE